MNGSQKYLVEEELEYYRDGLISRREFMRRATLFGAAAATAAAMAQGIVPRLAAAAPLAQGSPFSVAADDPAVGSEMMSYTSTDGASLVAYRAWPAGATEDRSLPGIAVCHMNRGLDSYTMDVARRYAVRGYVAFAPDLPSRLGVPTANLSPDDVRSSYRQLNDAQNARDFKVALSWLRDQPAVNPAKTAATGFCFGGGVIWQLATIDEQLTAAAPYYGDAPPTEDVPQIKAAMLGVYAGNDARVLATRPPLEAAMTDAGVRFQVNVYPNVGHAFHDDTDPRTYNEAAAVQAFMDTLNWFAQYLDLPTPTF